MTLKLSPSSLWGGDIDSYKKSYQVWNWVKVISAHHPSGRSSMKSSQYNIEISNAIPKQTKVNTLMFFQSYTSSVSSKWKPKNIQKHPSRPGISRTDHFWLTSSRELCISWHSYWLCYIVNILKNQAYTKHLAEPSWCNSTKKRGSGKQQWLRCQHFRLIWSQQAVTKKPEVFLLSTKNRYRLLEWSSTQNVTAMKPKHQKKE